MRSLLVLLLAGVVTAGLAIAQEGGEDGEGEVVEIRMVTEEGEFFFDPVGVHVEPGTTVRFINVTDVHSATAYCEENGKEQRIPEGAECWDSGVLTEEGAEFEVTLTEEGVYDYFCLPHEMMGMVGRIVVGSADEFPAREEGGLPPEVEEEFPSVEQIMEADDRRVPYEGAAQQ